MRVAGGGACPHAALSSVPRSETAWPHDRGAPELRGHRRRCPDGAETPKNREYVPPCGMPSHSVAPSRRLGVGGDPNDRRRRRSKGILRAALPTGNHPNPHFGTLQPTWLGVVETADEIDAAANVIGSRRLTGLRGLLEGSVSHDVAEHAGRPVLVVPSRRRRSAGGRNVGRNTANAGPRGPDAHLFFGNCGR